MNGGFLNFSVTSHGTRLFAYFQALWAGNSCQTLKTFIKWLDLEMFIKVYHRKIVRRTSQRSVNKDSLQPQNQWFSEKFNEFPMWFILVKMFPVITCLAIYQLYNNPKDLEHFHLHRSSRFNCLFRPGDVFNLLTASFIRLPCSKSSIRMP